MSQLGLFDDIEAAAKAEREAAAEVWAARFRIPARPLPWRTNDMREAGTVVDDWYRCPLCERVHLGRYSMWINCGWGLDEPGRAPVWAYCVGAGMRGIGVCGDLDEAWNPDDGWPRLCSVEPRFHDGACRLVPLAEWKQRPVYVEWRAADERIFEDET